MKKNDFQDEIDVTKYQRDRIAQLLEETKEQQDMLDDVEALLQNANCYIEDMKCVTYTDEEKKQYVEDTQDYQKLLQKIHTNGYHNIDLFDVATIEEVGEANRELAMYYHEYTKQYDLDAYDYAITGIIGTMSALMDLLLVTEINGGVVSAGKLKSGVEDLLGEVLSANTISELEKKYKVSYDISKNTSTLSQEVMGLCPVYHRFMSLGHDPLLGFIFGVKDLMKSELTAIDGSGRMIIQSVAGAESKNLLESIITVFGHFLSDVVTSSKNGKILSVPAPLLPLLQLVNEGEIDYKGQKLTVAELSKKMFYDGYNFNHFIGMSIPVFLNEVLVRICFWVKEIIYDKKDVTMNKNPKLRTMLFLSHSIMFSENIGKLVVTQNPFSINYISWITTVKYGINTLKWLTYDREIEKMDYAQIYIDDKWEELVNHRL